MVLLRRLLTSIPRGNPWSDGASALIVLGAGLWWWGRSLDYWAAYGHAMRLGLGNPIFQILTGLAFALAFFTWGKPRAWVPPLLTILLLSGPFGFAELGPDWDVCPFCGDVMSRTGV